MLTQEASRTPPKPTREQVAEAVRLNAELEKVQSLRPTLDDYVSEGVLPHMPEGKFSIPVNGRRVLEMNEQANRLAGWYGDNHADDPRRRGLREARGEKKARKFFRPPIRSVVGFGMSGWQYRCARGHTFGFLRAKPDADRRECVRDGCDAFGFLERA